MEVLRYAAHVSKVKSLNQFFHKTHIPFGILLLVICGFHGLLAGNLTDTKLADAELATVMFTVNWGTLCFLCAVLLAVSYLLRKKLRRKWMFVHRVLTILMIIMLAVHLADVGIRLPERWTNGNTPPQTELAEIPSDVNFSELPDAATPTPAATATPQPQISSTPTPTEGPVSSEPSSQIVSEEPEASPEAGIPDGVYTGRGQGRNGEIPVDVTVRDGKITDIQVISLAETPKYFSRAEGIIAAIVSAQSTEVDAVTGATISSDGIKAAVSDALEQ